MKLSDIKDEELLEAPVDKLSRDVQAAVAQDMENFAAIVMKTAGQLRAGKSRGFRNELEEMKYYYNRLLRQIDQ